MKYRKKPVVIEAIQWTGNLEEIKEFVGDSLIIEEFHGKFAISIKTLEGIHDAMFNDYIIKGVNGEFYPCKPDIFQKTYEKVEE